MVKSHSISTTLLLLFYKYISHPRFALEEYFLLRVNLFQFLVRLARMAKISGLIIIFLVLLIHPYAGDARKLSAAERSNKVCRFDKIYQLGDSIADTGNLVIESPHGSGFFFSKFPYGVTLGKATGRCSNGLLMIDYIASAFGLPFLNPFEKGNAANFQNGANFAVAGATALPAEAVRALGVPPQLIATNSSLGVQLGWMSSLFDSTCKTKEGCHKMLKNSLFMVGEIGGNDYNYALVALRNPDKLNGLVSDVVQTIVAAVKRVISFGATKVVVPGNFPIGCFPIYLTYFPSNDTKAYDSNQCLVGLNNLAALHNHVLQSAIEELKVEYPNTAIVYADYYNAFLSVLTHAEKHGFENKFSACCGKGGPYNFDLAHLCGSDGVTACPIPNNHISWDGIHLTQEAYKLMASSLMKSIGPQLKC